MRCLGYAFSVVMCVWAAVCTAQGSPDRFAFVIGNTDYETVNGEVVPGSPFNLVTPENDARVYAKTLASLGWRLLNGDITNRSANAINAALDLAVNEVTPGSEVVFVFNGHGFTYNSENYIVGIPDERGSFAGFFDMVAGSITLRDVVTKIASRSPSRIILIINACGDEPLMAEAKRAPARIDFSDVGAEVLVLYSSSPGGVAYDYIDSSETTASSQQDLDSLSFDDDGAGSDLLSLFTRAFVPAIEQEQPILQAFTEARITVERLSVRAALYRGLPESIGRQIPHILHDTINGRFSLFDVTATQLEAARAADWRLDPQSCRLNEASLTQALALRQDQAWRDDAEERAVRACILAAALGDLGIERLTFDGERGGVVVSTAAPDGSFLTGDLIPRATIILADGERKKAIYTSMAIFLESLEQYYFDEGTLISFAWKAERGSAFHRIEF